MPSSLSDQTPLTAKKKKKKKKYQDAFSLYSVKYVFLYSIIHFKIIWFETFSYSTLNICRFYQTSCPSEKNTSLCDLPVEVCRYSSSEMCVCVCVCVGGGGGGGG